MRLDLASSHHLESLGVPFDEFQTLIFLPPCYNFDHKCGRGPQFFLENVYFDEPITISQKLSDRGLRLSIFKKVVEMKTPSANNIQPII